MLLGCIEHVTRVSSAKQAFLFAEQKKMQIARGAIVPNWAEPRRFLPVFLVESTVVAKEFEGISYIPIVLFSWT